MTFNKYSAFLKVVELGSISKAADNIGYTQSAVSRMIADLESEWGLKLLHRNRGGLSLSSDGIQMLPYIQQLCVDYRSMQEQANALTGLETGFIRIGSCASVSTQWLPGILKAFEKQYPKIEFQLKNMEYSDTEEALRAGEIDCGFISAPYAPEIDFKFLRRDRMLAALPPDHPLADEDVYPLQDLSSERFIKLTDDTNNEVSKVLANLNAQLKEPLQIFCNVNDDYSAMAMVESGLGVSVLSELVTGRMPFDVRLKEFDMPQYRDIGIAVRKGSTPSPATQHFIAVVLNYFNR